MDGTNVGWWIPVLTVAVPLLLLLALHLLARLESWMFSPDDRADRVVRLLEESHTPDEVEEEVQRLLAEVADPHAPASRGRVNRAEERRSPGRRRVDRSFFQGRQGRRLRLRRAIARNAPEASEQGPG